MKPFYFSTKPEKALHPLIDSLPAIKAEMMLSIKNHNSKYNFEHISYYLNPYLHDYKPSCEKPIKNSEIEFSEVCLAKILKLLQSYSFSDETLFISKMTGKTASKRDGFDCVDEFTIAYSIYSKFRTCLIISGNSSQTEYLHAAKNDYAFFFFQKILMKRTVSNITNPPYDYLEELFMQNDDKQLEIEVSKEIDKYLNKDIVYIGYTEINKDFISLLNPKRLFTIHPYFAENNYDGVIM
ncbi:MAG: hypothetical protein Q8L90_04710 [Bacteroidota bacterium]|nr:hypothetical protein [Bacteroidota bacterium]